MEKPLRIKLDRTVCDGFGTCAMRAPDVFSLDDWGYPSLVGDGSVAPDQEHGVRRALLDCPAHAIIELTRALPMLAGGEPGVRRGDSPEAPWTRRAAREAGASGSAY
jgi:ferredoxin